MDGIKFNTNSLKNIVFGILLYLQYSF